MHEDTGLAQPLAATRPLKRSASVASLPTPPRTRRRRKLRSGVARDSDSDSEGVLLLDDDALPSPVRKGKEGKNGLVDDDEEEDDFWLGSGTSKTLSTGKSSKQNIKEADRSPSSSPVPLLERRKQASTSLGAAPVSPPPSRRVTSALPRKATLRRAKFSASPSATTSPKVASPATASPPVTPKHKRRSSVKRLAAQPLPIDSPDNPFIERSEESDVNDQDSWSPDPEPRTPHEERPTLAYVFRGVKAQLKNPLYDHANKRPLPPDPDSLLPPEHPDYSGDLTCPPKLLFPQAHRRRTRVRETRPKPPRDVDSSDDECNDLRSRMNLPAGIAAAPAIPDPPAGAGLRRSPRRRASGRGFAVAGVGS